MIKTLFTFQVNPTEVSKEILSFNNKTKDIVTVVIIILYFISSQILAYSLMPELYLLWISALSIVKTLLMSFIWFYAFNLGIQLFGKAIGGKGSFRDIGVVTAYSIFIYVVLNPLVSISSKLLWLGLFWSIGIFIPMIWFLAVYSKSLSQAQQFSESKVLVNVLVVGWVFYYLTNSVLPGLGL